jgi:hypothetical protein
MKVSDEVTAFIDVSFVLCLMRGVLLLRLGKLNR